MRILIYGAGAIGSVFAGKLALAGYDVTVLARESRFEELRRNGLILKQANSQKKDVAKVRLISKLLSEDIYDYVFVVMQKHQVHKVLLTLKENKSPNIVFVVNNASGYDNWVEAVGKKRLIIGFPSAGGERKDGIVYFFIGKGIIRSFQTTTFGEYEKSNTPRVKTIINAFNKAGIPSVSCEDMDSWQKNHVAMVTSIGNILYKYYGNNYTLSKSSEDIALMIKGIKEGFSVLNVLGYPTMPRKLNFFRLPTWLLTILFKIVMGTKLAETAMAKHTIVAKQEMICLQKEFDILIEKSGMKTPAIDKLKKYLYLGEEKVEIKV